MSTGDDADDAVERDKPNSSVRTMNSVLSTLRVFEEVAVRQPIGVSELARVTRIPKSSVQRCLVTLRQAGWLRVLDAEHARWGLTMKVLALGLRSAGEQDLRELAGPIIKRLAADTDETVLLGLRDGDEYLIVAREDSTQILRVIMDIGTRVPLRASTAGVAIIARLDPAEIDALLGSEAEEFVDGPVPSTEEVRAEIARAAERGYAVDMSTWYRPHVASFGAAITNTAGRPVAAVTLTIPAMRYDASRETALARQVVAAADEISRLVSSA
jgi:IclR family acetate operon transcriptional repressor